jgi:uncharacterized protein
MALLLRLMLIAVPLLAGCSSLYFLPMKPWVQNPANQGLVYEDIVLIHPRGERVHGWWLPAAGRAKGTVYFLHGNAQNISTHMMNVAWLPAEGFNVFLLDYRGYGLSEGKPRLDRAMNDIQLGLDWLRVSGRLSDRPLIVFGQSLGASMTIPVLAREENLGRYDCLISEAAFTGYRDIVADVMERSWLLWPMRPVVVPFQPRAFDPLDHIAAIRAPLLLLHSSDDEVIPFAHGEKLFEHATEPRTFQPLRGPHIAAVRDPQVRDRLLGFMHAECGAELKLAPVRVPTKPVAPESDQDQTPITSPSTPTRESLRSGGNGFTF